MAINELLSTVLKRQQIQHLLRILPTPICLSSILWTSWILVPKRYSDDTFWGVIVIQLLIAIYLLKSLQKDKPDLASAAKEIDRKLDTKERLTALISLTDEQQNSPLASILSQQLEPFLKDLKLSELIPLQISRVNLVKILLSIGLILFVLNKALTPQNNADQIALVTNLLNQHQLPSRVEESLDNLVDTLKREELSSSSVTEALNAAETALALAESEVLNSSGSQEEYLSGDSSPSASDVSNRLPSQGNNSFPLNNAKMPPTSTPTSTPASAPEDMNRKEDQNQKDSREHREKEENRSQERNKEQEQNKEEEKNKAQEVDVQHSKSSQQQGDKSGSKGDKSSEGDESSQSKDTNQGGDKSDKSGSDKDPANKGDQGKSGGSQGQGKDQGQKQSPKQGQKQEHGQNQGEQQAQGAKSSAQDGAGEGDQPGGQSAGQGEDQQTQQQESQQGKSSNGKSSNGESSGSEAGAKGEDPQGQESQNGGPNNASDKTDSGDEKSRGTGGNKGSNSALGQVKQGLDAIKDAQNKGQGQEQPQGQEQQESKKSANDQTQPSEAEGANQKGNSDKQEKSGKGVENIASRPGEVPPPSPSSKDVANRDRAASDTRSPSAAKEDNTSKDGKNSPPRKEQVSEQNSEQNNEATEEPDSKKSSDKQEGSGGMALPSEQSQTKEGLPEDGDGPASPQRPPKFQEKQIGEAQESYDLSATGSEQGRVLNKNDAEYKRRLKELSLSKPAERTDSQPQKVPLEYRGWLK